MIACLGWGSLIWEPRDLPIRRKWFEDGPLIRVEFVRQSLGDRLTLVIHPGTPPVHSLWAIMDSDDLGSAVKALHKREGAKEKYIGRWSQDDGPSDEIPSLSVWAYERGIQHVVWANLPPNLDGEEQAVRYLKRLVDEKNQKAAEEYIRKAPAQINTPYRRRFEYEFGWTSLR